MSQDKDLQVSNARRRFMQLGATAGGGLLFGFSLFGCQKENDRKEAPPEKAVGQASTAHSETQPGLARDAFIRIDRMGIVTLIVHKVEMGQGTFTAMPMLLAEELGADLSKVKLEQAPANNELYADPLLGGQVTGGSTSVRGAWKPLREAGAMVRSVLIAAASKQWNVGTDELQVVAGNVRHQASGRSAHFGELVDAASKMDLPKNVKLKDPEQFVLIGKNMRRLDSPAKVNGTAQFGIDARLPNMGIAAVAASPVMGGKLVGVDEQKAMAVKGVRQVLRLEGAVAVVADHFWAAKQGLLPPPPRWDDGANGKVNLKGIVADMMKVSQGGGAVAADKGNAIDALARDGGRKIEAVYEMPFLAHATMEPMNCTVDLRADGCDLWVGTQVPALAQGAAAKVAGLPVEKVAVHNHYIGGGFGRRLEVDYVIQAVAFAKLMKGPVKFIWTREEDIQHDMFRPYYVDRLAARLDDKGKPAAWFHRVTGSSIMSRFAPPAMKNGVDPDAVEGAADLQYTIPDMRVEYVRHEPPGVPTAFWRGVGPTHNVFVVESFIDELAHAAKQDPVAFRRGLLDKSPRTLAVLNLAAQKAGWGKPLAPIAGRKVGRGVSTQFAFGSYMAQVAEVSVGPDGDVRVHRVVCAVDCGQAVNPDTIVAQMEGGIVFGATAALWNEITLDRGRVQQTNFGDYRMMRINEAPKVEVHIVNSRDEPGGIGEPGTAGIAPALTNAVFAATGKRIRKLPIGEQLGRA
ncbi:xanthine dehydrogenase family protein molybdopterin-binding subunit [Massilia sp. Dwa41.01b]|uniref:xanthine dehydrogenase family protein molybdopterin-binding subunit n=1 Tax=Massilia sp. Dwa41.01b TaxID=2709302 RepID=UPI0016041338|nr:xanthine dehydrogenase family protein molybdopterin-binding subunit [Massilia sp. Dwa41.01b]QNA90386.1 xanthine dehydrogenase family protein molybdopterin-binding subunit [Massilia sp. Dwa41.01b]